MTLLFCRVCPRDYLAGGCGNKNILRSLYGSINREGGRTVSDPSTGKSGRGLQFCRSLIWKRGCVQGRSMSWDCGNTNSLFSNMRTGFTATGNGLIYRPGDWAAFFRRRVPGDIRFFANACAAASERLVLTFFTDDDQGASSYIAEVQSLFTDLKIQVKKRNGEAPTAFRYGNWNWRWPVKGRQTFCGSWRKGTTEAGGSDRKRISNEIGWNGNLGNPALASAGGAADRETGSARPSWKPTGLSLPVPGELCVAAAVGGRSGRRYRSCPEGAACCTKSWNNLSAVIWGNRVQTSRQGGASGQNWTESFPIPGMPIRKRACFMQGDFWQR